MTTERVRLWLSKPQPWKQFESCFRKKRPQFARAHQNWTVEDWKNVAWSDESRFLL